MTTLKDFNETPAKGYLARVVREGSSDELDQVEVLREDGHGLGSVPRWYVETLIENDEAPPTGSTAAAIFGDVVDEADEPAPSTAKRRR